MVGVGCKRFLKLFIIFMVLMPVTFAFAAIEFSTENTIYRAASSGIVFLEKPYYATQITFSNGFLMFSSFNYGSGTWGSIGFSCETETANMTLNAVQKDYLKYTVTATTSTTSITKTYLGSKGKPTSVVGADSWGYSSVNKMITVSVTHSSPQIIEFEWENIVPNSTQNKWVRRAFFPAMAFGSIIVVVMAAFMVMQGLAGNVDLEIIKNIIAISILLILGIIIGTQLT